MALSDDVANLVDNPVDQNGSSTTIHPVSHRVVHAALKYVYPLVGTLSDRVDTAQGTANTARDTAVSKYLKPAGGIPNSDLASPGGAADATTTTRGVIVLAGDLTGNAAAPEVGTGKVTRAKTSASVQASLALADTSVQPGNAALTDTRTPTDSTVTLAKMAADTLAALAATVRLTGAQTIAGVKTFTSAPVLPAGSVPTAALGVNAWLPVTYAANATTADRPVEGRLEAGSLVRLRGSIKSTGGTISQGLTLFTLPAEMWPSVRIAVVAVYPTGSTPVIGAVISTAGAVSATAPLTSSATFYFELAFSL